MNEQEKELLFENFKEFLDLKEEYRDKNKELIDEVNEYENSVIYPKETLIIKSIYEDFESKTAKTATINKESYYSEHLVNKLILFAYLKGQKDDRKKQEETFQNGWECCKNHILYKLRES